MSSFNLHPSSFRDPSGFVFEKDGKLYRQVNRRYADDYDKLMGSGLYEELVKKNLLVEHIEIKGVIAENELWYKTLEPRKVPVITYPYEWCHEQLKDAALLTLSIARVAVERGMILKDATPFNVQFVEGKPLFIDTLSFETYDESQPWVAYRQFCKMFLFPLYLEYYLRADIQKILLAYPEGIPTDITARLLPLKSGLSLSVWLHVYLQNTVTQAGARRESAGFSRKKLLNLLAHLESTINRLAPARGRSPWSNYYEATIIGKDYLQKKEEIFRRMISEVPACRVLDLGANNGYFSHILSGNGFDVIAVDDDSRSISKLYVEVKSQHIKNILPLVIDLSNPTPATGFFHRERPSFHQRIEVDLVVALALLHHLVIGKNMPLPMLAAYFKDIAPILIIEWVPREDEKVQQMLATRKDVFDSYQIEVFEQEFGAYFDIKKKEQAGPTGRFIYLMKKR